MTDMGAAVICWSICAACVAVTLLALWACLVLSRQRDAAEAERDALNDLLVARHRGDAEVLLVTRTRRYWISPAEEAPDA